MKYFKKTILRVSVLAFVNTLLISSSCNETQEFVEPSQTLDTWANCIDNYIPGDSNWLAQKLDAVKGTDRYLTVYRLNAYPTDLYDWPTYYYFEDYNPENRQITDTLFSCDVSMFVDGHNIYDGEMAPTVYDKYDSGVFEIIEIFKNDPSAAE